MHKAKIYKKNLATMINAQNKENLQRFNNVKWNLNFLHTNLHATQVPLIKINTSKTTFDGANSSLFHTLILIRWRFIISTLIFLEIFLYCGEKLLHPISLSNLHIYSTTLWWKISLNRKMCSWQLSNYFPGKVAGFSRLYTTVYVSVCVYVLGLI